ncbi:hypothetical protein LCL95_01120 [Bacillus timonensis]|nr:hypothetical protein [Bacillus timonensis]
MTFYYTQQAYGKAHNLSGKEGVFHFLEERKSLEFEVLQQLSRSKILTLDNSDFNWEKRYEEIEQALQEKGNKE